MFDIHTINRNDTKGMDTIMNREELKGLIQGVSCAVPTPFDNNFRLDLDKVSELTEWWVENGLGTNEAPIKVASAWGEGPSLNDNEWPELLNTVVKTAGSGANVMCGLKMKDTVNTIYDAKKAQDLGANGLQIDLPAFHSPNQDDYVRYYTDISDAIDIGIMIYNTYWFGCPPITADTMLRLQDAEHVVAVKWNQPVDSDYDTMTEFSHIFNVIDNSGDNVRCHKNGGRGIVSAFVAVNPQYELEIWRLLEEQRYDEAQAKSDKLHNAVGKFKPKTESGGYRLVKGMMEAIGRPAGLNRPPTLSSEPDDIVQLKNILKDLNWI